MDVEEMVKYKHIPTSRLLDLYGHRCTGDTYLELWNREQHPTLRFAIRKQLLEMYVKEEDVEDYG